ncbi:alpha/beta hydrolase [Draconibacterium sp. IB214405]|uniref:alpha/beta fold hydrolase n=1 Tax=Draconibacterium sp. IB214405 TaxID=3097352 RepID=UPI002A1556C7|nr:alpha/beta hydrolase [Draconibacterium sp. IB214405]MDX8339713.1 alpha/beta hydrolase [Draconibacterium sp. IB214405]
MRTGDLMVLFFAVFSLISVNALSQDKIHTVYLIPGQGADARLYKNLELDTAYQVKHIDYFTPEKDWDMETFARQLAKQIDTTETYSIIGVSLGGMLATEMTDLLHPEKVIVISSAKSRKEFPGRYRFQKVIPVHRLVPGFAIKMGAKILQPIVEPDRSKDKATFKSMLRNKDPEFLKRTTTMILTWKRETYNTKIVHIHGDLDKTLPPRFVQYDYLVEDGSHMMVLTRGELISEIVNNIMKE